MRYRFSQCLLLLLAICYLLQVFSPLRLNSDAAVLLSMGDSAAHGSGFLDSGQKTVFPPGYPALLAALIEIGLAHPWVIISLNAVFLSAGLLATYSLLIREFFEDKSVVLIICSLFLLSFIVVKHFPIPLTEVPFFGYSMCCLAIVSKARKMDGNLRFVTLVVAAWLLAVAAITTRRVGVALVPPLVFMIVRTPHVKSLMKNLSRRTALIILVAFVIIGVETMRLVAKTSTLVDFLSVAQQSKISTLVVKIFFLQAYGIRRIAC